VGEIERAAFNGSLGLVRSEGDIVARLRLGRVTVRAIPEQAHLQRYDLGPIARPAPVLRLVRAGRQPSLDVDLAALGQELLAGVSEIPERNHAMPFGPLLLLAVAILEPRGRCQREIRYVLTGVRQSPNLGVSAKISD
jgi:hypothetical protein